MSDSAKDQFSTRFAEARLLRERMTQALETMAGQLVPFDPVRGQVEWPESLDWGHVGELADICKDLADSIAHLERLARSLEARRQAPPAAMPRARRQLSRP